MGENAGKKKRNTENAEDRLFSVGIYARLSVDSHGRKNESIETQIEIAKAYMELQPDMVLYDCYSDLGKTGTNFARDGFKRLMTDIRLGRVDCVIVKDFSRFGRDYIETGNYIQKIFPFLGVRFLSVTDGYDSLRNENDELGMNLKNLVNELYARDIAIRVESSKRMQWEKGSYTGGVPPYGYRAEWTEGKKRLLAETVTSDIVKEIYRLFDSGKSRKEIAVWLYENRIHRPSDYRRYGHIYRQEGNAGEQLEELQEWSPSTVKLILTNPVYTGCLVQAGNCGEKYRMRRKGDMESEGRMVKENTHEAIIGEEQFFRVAQRFERQTVYSDKKCSKAVPPEEDMFEGILFCGACGRSMGRVKPARRSGSGDRGRGYGYFCRNSARIDGRHCERKPISYDSLTEVVKKALKQEFLLAGIRPEELMEKNKISTEKSKRELSKDCEKVRKSIERQINRGSERYSVYRKGKISREDFKSWKEESEKKVCGLKRKLEGLNRLLEEMDAAAARRNHFIRTLLRFDETSELSRELLTVLIDRINVYSDNRIVIKFCFTRKDFLRIENGGAGVE